MERDSLLAHGAAYLLHDRLHACSDYHVLDVCTKCGSLLAPLTKPHAASSALGIQGMVRAAAEQPCVAFACMLRLPWHGRR